MELAGPSPFCPRFARCGYPYRFIVRAGPQTAAAYGPILCLLASFFPAFPAVAAAAAPAAIAAAAPPEMARQAPDGPAKDGRRQHIEGRHQPNPSNSPPWYTTRETT